MKETRDDFHDESNRRRKSFRAELLRRKSIGDLPSICLESVDIVAGYVSFRSGWNRTRDYSKRERR